MNQETKRTNSLQQQRNEENLGGARVLLSGKRVDDSPFLTFQIFLTTPLISLYSRKAQSIK